MSSVRPQPPTVCVIAGDDAAPEVMRPTVEVLRQLAPDIRFVEAVSGREAQERYGEVFPAVTRAAIDAADCTLFGASGGPSRPCPFSLSSRQRTPPHNLPSPMP